MDCRSASFSLSPFDSSCSGPIGDIVLDRGEFMVGPEAFVVVGCCFCLDPSVLILAFIFIVLDTTVPCLAALFKENYVLFSGMISCCESP